MQFDNILWHSTSHITHDKSIGWLLILINQLLKSTLSLTSASKIHKNSLHLSNMHTKSTNFRNPCNLIESLPKNSNGSSLKMYADDSNTQGLLPKWYKLSKFVSTHPHKKNEKTIPQISKLNKHIIKPPYHSLEMLRPPSMSSISTTNFDYFYFILSTYMDDFPKQIRTKQPIMLNWLPQAEPSNASLKAFPSLMKRSPTPFLNSPPLLTNKRGSHFMSLKIWDWMKKTKNTKSNVYLMWSNLQDNWNKFPHAKSMVALFPFLNSSPLLTKR